jgi:hypothetical protein
MERAHETSKTLEELGTVSLDTQGSPGLAWEVTGPDRKIGIAAD